MLKFYPHIRRTIPILIAAIMLIILPQAKAADISHRPNIAVFAMQQNNLQLDAITNESVREVLITLENLGRFLPAEANQIESALRDAASRTGDQTKKAAETLGVDIYVTVVSYRRGNMSYADMRVMPLGERYKRLARNITVKSSISSNIPFKLAREIAYLHRDMDIKADVIKNSNGTMIISAGQWHGLRQKSYPAEETGSLDIIETRRYHSYAKTPAEFIGKSITIKVEAAADTEINRLEKIMENNLIYKNGLKNTLLKGEDPEKRFVLGSLVINPLSSTIVPVYGSFLSAGYMGFDNHTPSVPGLVYSGVLILTQLMLPEILTGFTINYWPWIEGGVKTAAMQNLQIFMFATMPLTGTAAFLDQLAYLFDKTDKLPPFFERKNGTAAMLSLFIPGGGLFYKGWRILGWSYYTSEMMLAGFGFYYLGRPEYSGYFFLAYAAMKLAEIINAYFINPGYNFYNTEMSGETRRPEISLDIRNKYLEKNETEMYYGLAAKLSF